MKKTNNRKNRSGANPSFQQLSSYRLHQLSTISERLIGTRYREKFGLRMMEVGILIMVGESGPLSFKRTYSHISLEKSNASRAAAKLLKKGLLEKRHDPADQRSFYLALTSTGQKLFRELYADALARNERWIGVLQRKERATFLACLDRLTQHTQKLLRELGRTGGAGSQHGRARGATRIEPPPRILLDKTAASQLYTLLGTALGKNER